jgi:hypothetical protein
MKRKHLKGAAFVHGQLQTDSRATLKHSDEGSLTGEAMMDACKFAARGCADSPLQMLPGGLPVWTS